jgi:hypothetical protein
VHLLWRTEHQGVMEKTPSKKGMTGAHQSVEVMARRKQRWHDEVFINGGYGWWPAATMIAEWPCRTG